MIVEFAVELPERVELTTEVGAGADELAVTVLTIVLVWTERASKKVSGDEP